MHWLSELADPDDASSGLTTEDTVTDSKFRKKFFHGQSDEIVLQTLECTSQRKRVRLRAGQLYISKRYICFEGRIFGVSFKQVHALKDIEDIYPVQDDGIDILGKSSVFQKLQ